MRRTPSLHTFAAATVVFACGQAVAQEWSLFGRHGECAPISSLKRKLHDLPEIKTPGEFAAYLESKRLSFTRQNHQAGGAGGVEFQVPDAGLAIVFVASQQCATHVPAAR